MAYSGWQYVMILRLLNGLGASAVLPVMVRVIELWMPAHESTLGLTIVQSVQSIIFTLSPLISGASADVHWKWAFYIPALVALVFCALWFVIVFDNPTDCWFVSQEELDIICGCNDAARRRAQPHDIKSMSSTDHSSESNNQPEVSVPWTRALRLKSFYALTGIWIFYCSSFCSFSFLNPSYMRQVLKVPIMENGKLCFIIQSGCMISVIWPMPFSSLLQIKYKCSLTAARRIVLTFSKYSRLGTWTERER